MTPCVKAEVIGPFYDGEDSQWCVDAFIGEEKARVCACDEYTAGQNAVELTRAFKYFVAKLAMKK